MSARPAPTPLPWRNSASAIATQTVHVPATSPKIDETVAVEVGINAVRCTLHLPPKEVWVVGQIFEKGVYDGVPTAVLSNPPIVVDVGGHCGVFAAYARMAWHPKAVVHSFEPFPLHVQLLRRNTTAFPEVTIHPFGLGISDGTTDLFLDPGSGSGHSTVPGKDAKSSAGVPVPMRDAAAVWAELGLSDVDVLKIDAEGAEVAILELLGARLSGVRILLVEYHSDSARRRVDAILPWHVLFGCVIHSPQVGTLKYIRADLTTSLAKPPVPVRNDPPRVLFASYHCFEDSTSGAALCTHDLFDLLSARGWSCEVFTGPHLDGIGTPVNERLSSREGATSVAGQVGPTPFTEFKYQAAAGYPVTVLAPDPPAARRPPTLDEAKAFAARLEVIVRKFRPDLVLFYGGDAASRSIPAIVKLVGANAAFWLHNYAYPTREPFRECDAVIVPSADSREHYRSLGVEAVPLPGPWNWERARCEQMTPKYVTFVNPEPAKGVFWFARIAEVLGRTRPDIPLLVVEGRGTVDWLTKCGLNLGASGSLRRMRNTTDPKRFYRLSKLVLVPSLWKEALSRVAVEAMGNGIPVIGSGRGGLKEVLSAGGIQVDIPTQFTPETKTPPTESEVADWVAAITRLWDDPETYALASAKARVAFQRNWHPDVLIPTWVRFLSELASKAAK